MTIRPNINARELNSELGFLEDCAREAPEGTYELAKETAEAISDIANYAMSRLSEAGLKVSGDDRLREVEAILFGYIQSNNPGALATAIGFGEHVNGPARHRVIARAASDRDFLRQIEAIQ